MGFNPVFPHPVEEGGPGNPEHFGGLNFISLLQPQGFQDILLHHVIEDDSLGWNAGFEGPCFLSGSAFLREEGEVLAENDIALLQKDDPLRGVS